MSIAGEEADRMLVEQGLLVGDNSTVLHFMPPCDGKERVFIAKARAPDCRLVRTSQMTFSVIHKQKGFPGMAAAWFPGEHQDGPARDFLAAVSNYIPAFRSLDPVLPPASGRVARRTD